MYAPCFTTPVATLLDCVMSGIALARFYDRSFGSYPHFTLAVAGGALTALGDVVAQLSQQIVRFTPYIFALFQKYLLDYTRKRWTQLGISL